MDKSRAHTPGEFGDFGIGGPDIWERLWYQRLPPKTGAEAEAAEVARLRADAERERGSN